MQLTIVVLFTALTFLCKTLYCLQLESFRGFLDYNHLNHGIIVMCDDDTIPLQELKTFSTNYKYYWLSYFHVDRANFRSNIAAFNDLFYYGAPRVGIYLNIECQAETNRILQHASANNFFNSSQAWFVLANSTARVLDILSNLKINIDADITLGIKVSRGDILRLYDLYNVCHQCGTGLQIAAKGSWNAVRGMQVLPHFWQTTVQRRRNFRGISLKGGIVITSAPDDIPVLEYVESFDNKHIDAMQRKCYHLLKLSQDIYNFQLELVISDNWGIQHDGNWTGVIGNLLDGSVDISLSPLRFTQTRVLAVRYLPELHIEIIRFLFRHPRRSTIRNIFLQPFTSTVWYAVLAVIAAGVLLLAITMHHECECYEAIDGSENKLDFYALIILEAIFLQGPSETFQLVSTRTLIISICIFAVMLYQFYSAFIVGSLLADVPRTIVNMPALFNSSLDIGMEDIAYNYEFFINTSNQMAKDIYVHRIMRNPRMNILPLQSGLERISRGGYAYHVAVVRAYRKLKERLTESQFCDLQEVAMDPPFASCPAVPHGSPFKEHFANAILQFRETGIMAYHDKLWSVEKPQCSQKMTETETTVDMEHFIPALGFLAVAMLTSLLIFILELAVHFSGAFKWRKKTRQLGRRISH